MSADSSQRSEIFLKRVRIFCTLLYHWFHLISDSSFRSKSFFWGLIFPTQTWRWWSERHHGRWCCRWRNWKVVLNWLRRLLLQFCRVQIFNTWKWPPRIITTNFYLILRSFSLPWWGNIQNRAGYARQLCCGFIFRRELSFDCKWVVI